ncbi:response regulator transcription factor [Nostocoides sp. F2B08]|uniref:response regulator n=1 Tax=Nostocoides sp. F2B08 TaxID=2653936 RepID=UPI00186B32AD|nr:response regulator transcription factor [Tetrasphaera sp. F2B08]
MTERATAAAPPGRQPVTVVVVDDHPALLAAVVDLLAVQGITVLATASTVRGGYHAIMSHHPDVAVVNNRLPDGFGLDLCQMIRRAALDVALVVHTAEDGEGEDRARAAGADEFVLKVADGHELLDAIRRHAPGRFDVPGRFDERSQEG